MARGGGKRRLVAVEATGASSASGVSGRPEARPLALCISSHLEPAGAARRALRSCQAEERCSHFRAATTSGLLPLRVRVRVRARVRVRGGVGVRVGVGVGVGVSGS